MHGLYAMFVQLILSTTCKLMIKAPTKQGINTLHQCTFLQDHNQNIPSVYHIV